MKLKRTANAGILLTLDGITVLLDGVCREVRPYPATPLEIKAGLMKHWPDIAAFTHNHKDHYDPAYAAAYMQQTGRVILMPGTAEAVSVGNVTVLPVPSRHIGAAGKTVAHTSYLIKGSQCVWFLGDAAPNQWRGREDLPAPDVLVVPYTYCNTPSSWARTKSLGARKVVLLHMPEKGADTLALWNGVESTVNPGDVQIPAMGQTLEIC